MSSYNYHTKRFALLLEYQSSYHDNVSDISSALTAPLVSPAVSHQGPPSYGPFLQHIPQSHRCQLTVPTYVTRKCLFIYCLSFRYARIGMMRSNNDQSWTKRNTWLYIGIELTGILHFQQNYETQKIILKHFDVLSNNVLIFSQEEIIPMSRPEL